MLKIIGVYISARDPVTVVEDSIVDRVDNSKVNKVKVGTKIAKSKGQDKSKTKIS